MAKKQPLRVVGYLEMPDGSYKPIDDLTEEEKERWHIERRERLIRNMTDYYRQHPEAFALLPDAELDAECT